MLKFAANISWMYREWPFLERPIKAAEDGFDAVECLFPYQFSAQDLSEVLKLCKLPLILINAPAGNWDNGDRGLAGLPNREGDFIRSLEMAWQYAQQLDCKKIHLMSGLVHTSMTLEKQYDCLIERLKFACDQAEALGITVLIEALNADDMPNYLIPNLTTALMIHERVDRKNLKIQFDLYHQQRTEGDLSKNLVRIGNKLGHIQCAGVPGRHEPNDGEVDYGYIFKKLSNLKFEGWIGAEYDPRKNTRDGLGWLEIAEPFRISQ